MNRKISPGSRKLCAALADWYAYTALRNIYWSYHEKRLSREQGTAEKLKLYREWEKARESEKFDRELMQQHVEQRKAQELALNACRKEPTAENAIKLCDVLDGLDAVRNIHDNPEVLEVQG